MPVFLRSMSLKSNHFVNVWQEAHMLNKRRNKVLKSLKSRLNILFMVFVFCLVGSLNCSLNCNLAWAQVMTPSPKPSNMIQDQPRVMKQVVVPIRGTILKSELEKTVQGGVPALLAQVRIRPIHKKGRFSGFQLAYIKPNSQVEKVGFKVGDILINVNGEPIGRPEQMMHTLSLLPYADQIKITFERDRTVKQWIWLVSSH